MLDLFVTVSHDGNTIRTHKQNARLYQERNYDMNSRDLNIF